ncbi:uncharacterized protein LOC119655066 [Hermetia illucens]|uniref:uncharacterized protein LOC119655066 n=1 Tax=Hermetia illucens TaxID=343691 RepID=UPI0018CC7AD6|nr:uncharacterized protein LOC119655066 [Hermetia illucens]
MISSYPIFWSFSPYMQCQAPCFSPAWAMVSPPNCQQYFPPGGYQDPGAKVSRRRVIFEETFNEPPMNEYGRENVKSEGLSSFSGNTMRAQRLMQKVGSSRVSPPDTQAMPVLRGLAPRYPFGCLPQQFRAPPNPTVPLPRPLPLCGCFGPCRPPMPFILVPLM